MAEWEKSLSTFDQIDANWVAKHASACKSRLLQQYEADLSHGFGKYKVFISTTIPEPHDDDDDDDDDDLSSVSSEDTMPHTNKSSQTPGQEVISHSVCVNLIVCSKSNLKCHWGIKSGNQAWRSVIQHNAESSSEQHVEYIMESTEPVNQNAVNSYLKLISPHIYIAEFIIPVAADLMTAPCDSIEMVYHDPPSNTWVKTPDMHDISIKITSKSASKKIPKECGSEVELASSIIECECEWQSMTLWHRYNMIMERVRSRQSGSLDFWTWIFVWLRFSHLNWLDWQRCYNTRPSLLSHSTMELSLLLAEKWRQQVDFRFWTRMCVSCVGRGGNQGQRIRDQILEIMHKHKISERAGHFYEQWHQKLHNNTTPDDIGICKAVIRYYESNGNMGLYWQTLKEHGIDAAKLASYERPITHEPYLHDCDRGELLRDWYGYLEVLMDVHDCRDLRKSLDRSRGNLPEPVIRTIENELFHSRQTDKETTINKLKALDYVRGEIFNTAVNSTNAYITRDLVLLDFSLESIQNTLLQNTDRHNMNISQAVEVISLLVKDRARGLKPEMEWGCISEELRALGGMCARNEFTRDKVQDALMLKALLDRLTRALGDEMEVMQSMLGPKSLLLGTARSISANQLNVFVDEILRGSVLFSISQMIAVLEPKIRAEAKMSPWQIISPVTKIERAVVESVPMLHNLQEKKYNVATILICGRVNGEEDIPAGVVGIIVRDAASAPDVLSHVSVRARNSKVLLAVCFDKNVIQKIEELYNGKMVSVELLKGFTELAVSSVTAPTTESTQDISSPVSNTSSFEVMNDLRKLTFDSGSDRYCVLEKDYTRQLVGSKSYNLKLMKENLVRSNKLGSVCEVPKSCAFIYGSFEKCLDDPLNHDIKLQLEGIARKCKSTSNRQIKRAFDAMAPLVLRLEIPPALRTEFRQCLIDAELVTTVDERDEASWYEALKRVWASLFQMRPWVALSKAQKSWNELSMAVLVQNLVDADYAFVLHSKHPFRDEQTAEDFMYGELVQGLGEVLVGNHPGRALSWECHRTTKKIDIVSWPSKSSSLKSRHCLMFRSDSNGEDLEDFAGAGLFESIPSVPNKLEPCLYHKDRMVIDAAYRAKLLGLISEAAWNIQNTFGQHMDIEGCVSKDMIHIVQCRPQV